MTEQENNEFVEVLLSSYYNNRQNIPSELTDDELIKNEYVKRCLIINALINPSSIDVFETAYAIWIQENKNIEILLKNINPNIELKEGALTMKMEFIDDKSTTDN